MNTEKHDGLEIDIQKLLLTYLRRWWLIFLCCVIAAAGTMYYTRSFITPKYQAKVTIYVNNYNRTMEDKQVETITSGNLSTSQRLVSTYVEIIRSDSVLEKVAAASGLKITASQIKSAMSASQVEETELFNVFIVDEDPARAQQIANAVAEVAPEEIKYFVEGSSAKIVDWAKKPTSPISPDVRRNTALGAIVGAAFALIIITVQFLLDVRIKDEEDLTMIFDYPVLSQIPAFIQEGTKRYGSYGGYRRKGYGYAATTAEPKKGAETDEK